MLYSAVPPRAAPDAGRSRADPEQRSRAAARSSHSGHPCWRPPPPHGRSSGALGRTPGQHPVPRAGLPVRPPGRPPRPALAGGAEGPKAAELRSAAPERGAGLSEGTEQRDIGGRGIGRGIIGAGADGYTAHTSHWSRHAGRHAIRGPAGRGARDRHWTLDAQAARAAARGGGAGWGRAGPGGAWQRRGPRHAGSVAPRRRGGWEAGAHMTAWPCMLSLPA